QLNEFSDSLGAGGMARGGEYRREAGTLDDVSDLMGIGGDDDAITHAQVGDASDHPENEGLACQLYEGLAGQTAGAQPSRNHAKDGHRGTYKICAAASRGWPMPPPTIG